MVTVGLTTGAISSAPMAMSIQVNNVEYADHRFNPAAASIDISSIRISQDVRGNATASFDIIDKNGTLGQLPTWCDVRIWDGYVSLRWDDLVGGAHSPNAVPWQNGNAFSGMLVHQSQAPAYGIGQVIHCECVDYGLLLDRTFIPSFTNFWAAGATQSPTGIRDLIELVAGIGGIKAPLWINPGFLIDLSDSAGATIVSTGDSTRGLLDLIVSEIVSSAGTIDYFFFVTADGQFVVAANAGGVSTPLRRLAEPAIIAADIGRSAAARFIEHYLVTDSATGGPDSYAQLVWDTPGLVGYWRLDEETGTVAYGRFGTARFQNSDLAGNTQWDVTAGWDPGTYTGAPTLAQKIGLSVAGEANTGVVALVAASSQYVTVPTSPRIALGDTITFECWVARSTATAQGIMNLGAGSLQVVWNADGSISGQKAGTGDFMKSTTTIPSDSSFHHVVVVKSPGAAAIYIDGVSVGGAYTAQTLSTSASALEMGRQQGGTNYLNGWLGQCALYSTAVAAQDAIAHYRARTIVPGTTKAENISLDTDGTQEESAVWNPTLGRFVYVDEALALDRGAQAAYRQLATSALQPGVTGQAYLGPKATRVRGQMTITGRDAPKLGQSVWLTNAALDQVNVQYTIYGIDTAFISGTGLRKHTLRIGATTVLGSKPSAARQLQARLAKSGI